MRFKRPRRSNPDLILFTNPSPGGAPPLAPSAWARFHYAEADDADWAQIPDIPGLPKVVWALGFFRGGRFIDDEGAEIEQTIRAASSGPWLVSAPSDKKALWVVGKDASSLRQFARFEGAEMSAIMYYPSETSGKHVPGSDFIHLFGDGGSVPKRDWSKTWPTWERVNERCYEVVGPHRFGFTVEPGGITG